MKSKFVKIDAAISDWKDDHEYEADIDEGLLKKWAQDCVSRISTDEQTVHSIAILQVNNYRAYLPEGFKMLCQVAYKVEPEKKCEREQIVQWTQKIWGEECELEINLKCPECHKQKCDCSSPVVTLDVDEMWAQAHPEHYVAYMNHFHSFGRTKDYNHSSFSNDFALMKPRVGNFSNIPYHINNCPNFYTECEYTYELQPPHITVNFKKGELLLSYFATPLDEDGYPFIPDTAAAFSAIRWWIQERMMYRRYLKELDRGARQAWQDALQLKELWVGRARNELQIPDADIWYNKMRDTWSRNWPKYDWWEATSSYYPDRFGTDFDTFSPTRTHI